jgi:hypothetical protein
MHSWQPLRTKRRETAASGPPVITLVFKEEELNDRLTWPFVRTFGRLHGVSSLFLTLCLYLKGW